MNKMRKGYIIIILFSLSEAIFGTIKYRILSNHIAGEASVNRILFQTCLTFIVFVVPGVLLVRWYYRGKGE